MKRRLVALRLFSSALCLLVFAFGLAAGTACAQSSAASPRRRVRVGFFAFEGYHIQAEDGSRSGYGYDLLQYLAGYANWRYEYVGYDRSWNDMQAMLAAGEIDLLTSAQKTEDRENRFVFSKDSIGTSSAILTVKAGQTAYAVGDYAHWNGMRVGMIEGNSRNDSFAAFAAEHGFTYQPVYYGGTAEVVAALNAGGEIDGIVTSSLRQLKGEWVLAQFDSSPFYIMLRKGDTALLNEVNAALERLFASQPELCSKLMNRYYAPFNGDEVAYTAEERAFIAKNRDTVFTAALNPDRAPLSYLENGQLTGILYDVAQRVISRTGLNVRFLPLNTRQAYWQAADAGQADIRFDALFDFNQAEKQGYRLTEPYFDLTLSRLYRRSAPGFSSAAMLRSSDVAKNYGKRFEGLYGEVVYYDSMAELVQAVSDGRQDAGYVYLRCAEKAAHDDVTNRLTAQSMPGYGTSFAVAVNADQDPMLFSVLNKAVGSFSKADIEAIDRRYTSYENEPFSLIGYAYDHPIHMALFVAAVCLIAGLTIMVVHNARDRGRKAARLAEEERRGRLLEDALNAAENADAAKSQFLSRVSHEMRTPLNAIIGFMELAKGAQYQEMAGYMLNAEVAAKQLLAVINDVLDMSSIESGKLKLAHAPFDFKQLISGITGIYVPLCHQKGVAYETTILTPVDEWLVGDQLRVSQILNNLLSNAVKFTTAGHVWLEISQTESKKNETFIRFQVSDTGCGMSDEMKNRLFQPFEQENSVTAQKYGGSGLGLSIVKSLVSMMHGAIKVESRQGAGTTFTVDLPFGRSDLNAGAQTAIDAGHLRILFVDDEANERQYLTVVLNRMGVRHTCVSNGDAAMEALKQGEESGDPYQMCLVDWRMPGMGGLEITKLIRQRYGKNVVVIVVSAYEHYQADDSAKEAGANLFVPKPLFQSTLFDLLMTLTGGSIAKTKPTAEQYHFEGRRVLLAEDNAMNRIVTQGLVRKYGVACDCAEDGLIAVRRFTQSAKGWYNAVLMDIQMPNVDGYEATRMIRASHHPDAQTIPIIALTANAFNEDVAHALSCGMNAHVAKPIDPGLLAEALRTAFETDFQKSLNDRETNGGA